MPLNHQAAEGKQNKPNLPAGIFLGGKVMDQNLQKIMDKRIEKTIGNLKKIEWKHILLPPAQKRCLL